MIISLNKKKIMPRKLASLKAYRLKLRNNKVKQIQTNLRLYQVNLRHNIKQNIEEFLKN